jgi:Transposase DDE domain/Insertion element 4 transposase N-terminal
MGYRKDAFTRPQFLATLKLLFPAAAVRRAVASNGRATRERVWPQWLLLWTLIGWYFQAGWALPAVARWFRPLAGRPRVPSESALCQARRQLGYKPVWYVRTRLVRWLADPAKDPTAFYRGRRLVGVDGTTFSVADTKANERTFGRAGNQHKPSGYPLVRVVALCELGTHALVRWVARRYRRGERTLLARLVRHVPAKSLLLGDRNCHSYGLFEQADRRRFDLLLRVAKGVQLPVGRRLADGSYLSVIRPRRCRAHRDKPAIVVRVIQYQVRDGSRRTRGRLVTSLVDPADGPARELAELYACRWEHESAFREVKQELSDRHVCLRGQSPRMVLQELDALLLGHYVVRTMILAAARAAAVAPVEVSFVGALQVVRMRLGSMPATPRAYARWYAELVAEIAALPRRRRRRRAYPRVRKVVRCPWPVKRPHHRQQTPRPLRKRLTIIR